METKVQIRKMEKLQNYRSTTDWVQKSVVFILLKSNDFKETQPKPHFRCHPFLEFFEIKNYRSVVSVG
jgi:hypothetical protein